MDVVESVNVHDDIKIGLPSRDKYIENYKTTLRNLAKFGVRSSPTTLCPSLTGRAPTCSIPCRTAPPALFYEKSKNPGRLQGRWQTTSSTTCMAFDLPRLGT